MGLRIIIDSPVTFQEESLDLFEGTNFWITKQIHDLQDLSTRDADYTKQIAVPITAKNTILLRANDLFDVADAQAVIAVPCDIILDGIPIANDAKLYVDELVNDDEYAIVILFGNFNFFDKIQGNIEDLDFSSETFEYTMESIDGTPNTYTVTTGTHTGGTLLTIIFQAAQPTPAMVLGQQFEIGNLANGGWVVTTVTNVVDAQTYDTDALAAGSNVDRAQITTTTSDTLKLKTDNVVYPLSDYFNIFDTVRVSDSSAIKRRQDIEISGWWFYCKDIMLKIVTDAGFTLDLSAINLTLYDKLVINCPFPFFVTQESDSSIGQQIKANDQLVDGRGAGAGNTIERVEFDDNDGLISSDASWSIPNDEYTWISPTNIAFLETFLDITNLTAGNGQTVTIELFHDLVVIDSIVLTRDDVQSTVTLTGSVTVVLNDTFYVLVTCSNGTGGNGGAIDILNVLSTITIGKQGSAPDRTINNPATFFPPINKRDFFTGILSMMNIVLQTNDLEKIVVFENFDGILDNEEQTVTIDTTKETKRSSLIGNYFRNSKFQYKEEPSSDLVRTDTDAIFVIEDERLKIDGSVVELPFQACDDSLLYQEEFDSTRTQPNANVNAYSFELDSKGAGYFWDEDGGVVTTPDDASLSIGNYIGFPTELRRITQVNSSTLVTVAGTWNAENTVGTGTVVAALGIQSTKIKIARIVDAQDDYLLGDGLLSNAYEAGNVAKFGRKVIGGLEAVFDDPMLWNDLLNEEYTELLNALKQPLLLQLSVFLTTAEFNAIDFLRPIYLGSPYNASFYINRISQFIAGQAVRIDLVRISTT